MKLRILFGVFVLSISILFVSGLPASSSGGPQTNSVRDGDAYQTPGGTVQSPGGLVPSSITDIASRAGDLTALAILGGVVFYMFGRILPKMLEESNEQTRLFAEHSEKQRKEFTDAIVVMHGELRENTKAVGDLQTHCAVELSKR